MLNQFSRTQLLLGKEAMDRLKGARVAVFGIGGVGGYVCEALVRSGVGAIDLIDDDKVCLTNLNRQIIATRKTIGKYKTDVMEERIHDINPDVSVVTHRCFFLPENADEFPFEEDKEVQHFAGVYSRRSGHAAAAADAERRRVLCGRHPVPVLQSDCRLRPDHLPGAGHHREKRHHGHVTSGGH